MNSDNTSTTSSKQKSVSSSKSKKSRSSSRSDRSKLSRRSSDGSVKSSSSKKKSIPPSSPKRNEVTNKTKTGNSSLTARANEYMKRSKEKKLQQQKENVPPSSPKAKKEIVTASLVPPASPKTKKELPAPPASPKTKKSYSVPSSPVRTSIKKSQSVPSSPIPTSMRAIPSTPTTTISMSATNTPIHKKKPLPMLTPKIFSESPLPPQPPKTNANSLPFDEITKDSDSTKEEEKVQSLTPFYTPSSTITSFYTPTNSNITQQTTTTYSYYNSTETKEEKETIISFNNNVLQTPDPNYTKEKKDLTLTTSSRTTATELMTSFENTPIHDTTASQMSHDAMIRKLTQSFSCEEESKKEDVSNASPSAAAFFLDDLEHMNDDDNKNEEFKDTTYDNLYDFDINAPDDEAEEEKQPPKKEDDESTNIIINAKNKNKPKKSTVLKDLIMSMEKTDIEEGIEIYDTEYYIRSIVYAVQSAEDAEKVREEVKDEWTTGTKKVEIEDDDTSSIDTRARMDVINDIAFQTITSLVSKTSITKKLPPPPKFSKYEQENIPSQKVLQYLKSKMKLPKRSIADLLNAILCNENKWSRKKNACGAFKFLCMKHSKGMAYTHGVLSTIACVFNTSSTIMDDVSELDEVEKEDELQAYYDARSRIVLAFISLCKTVKNRILIVHTPGLIQSMIQVLQQYHEQKFFVGDSQQGICECLALLAKTRENRISLLQQVYGNDLIKSLTNVINVHTSCPNFDVDVLMEDDDTIETMNSTNDDVSSIATSDSDSTDADHTIEENNTTNIQHNDVLSQSSTHDADDESSGEISHSSASTSSTTSSASSSEADEESLFSAENTTTVNEEIELIVDLKANKKRKSKKMVKGNNEKYKRYYDNHGNHYLTGARIHTFAALLHLANNKTNAYTLCRDNNLVTSLVEVSTIYTSKSHTKAIMILAHLTRLHYNNHQMVFIGSMSNKIISTFVNVCHYSTNIICKLFACYAIQNLSFDKTCRQELAIIPGLLNGLKLCCLEQLPTNKDTSVDIEMKEEEYEYYQEELQLAAIRALCNLCDEHANIIYLSNTLDCIPTIIQLSQKGSDLVSFIASDCLAYLSRSLTSISDNGMMLCVEERKMSMVNLPSFEVTHWDQWE